MTAWGLGRCPTPPGHAVGSQPESKLSRAIMAALRARGAFVWKNHGGATMMAGLPDIAGVYRGQFIAIETKMPDGGEPTPIQVHRHHQIRDAGGHVTVARTVAEAVQWADAVTNPHPMRLTPQRPTQGGLRVSHPLVPPAS